MVLRDTLWKRFGGGKFFFVAENIYPWSDVILIVSSIAEDKHKIYKENFERAYILATEAFYKVICMEGQQFLVVIYIFSCKLC